MPFAVGIWIAYSFLTDGLFFPMPVLLNLVIVMTSIEIVLSAMVKKYSLRWIFGFILNLLLLIIGVLIVRIRSDDIDVNNISFNCNDNGCYLIARVSECPLVKEKSVKVVLDMIGEKSTKSVCRISGKVMSYFEKSESSEKLRYGDVLVFFDPPNEIDPPKNPEQFDYKKYLSRKSISRQIYVKTDRWMHLNLNLSNPIYRFSYRLRDLLLNIMQNLGITGDEYAVAAAILIGYDDTLPQELRDSYVAAGSMHILCVSGMHVGVVFMVFSYILAFIGKRKRWQNLLRQALLLMIIWVYALLAGLAPSILRATIMLSFVILGNMLNRNGILINSLAASAFLLLAINPANLFDIGFQLSYAAVVGIVVLQKQIYCLLYIKNRLLDKIWELTSVAMAAQFATAPFSIFYFHQFPLYFWLSNLFMTPISTVVIVGGLIMLTLYYIPYINMVVAWIVKWMIFLMNYVVTSIENLPLSIVKGLYVNELEFVCLIVFVVLIIMTTTIKNKKTIFAALSFLLIFSISQLSREMEQRNQSVFTVYSMQNGTAVDFVYGNEHVVMCDTTVSRHPDIASFSMENNLIKDGVYRNGSFFTLDSAFFDNQYIKKRGNIVSFGKRLIGFSDENAPFGVKMMPKQHLDCFLMYGKPNAGLDDLLDLYVIDLLIIDGSIPSYMRQNIIEDAEEKRQRFYDIKTNGAFILENY